MRTRLVEVALDATEWPFLVTTLRGTTAMLKAPAALHDALPGGFQLPITAEMIVNTAALTETIEGQLKLSSGRRPGPSGRDIEPIEIIDLCLARESSILKMSRRLFSPLKANHTGPQSST